MKLRCGKCKQWKDEAAFSPRKNRSRAYKSECKPCSSERQRVRYRKLRDNDICPACGEKNTTATVFCGSCREKEKPRTWQASRKLKLEVLNMYGGVFCSCCGETDVEFLSIDHIDGGGEKHRREIGVPSGNAFYRWLKKNNWPAGYQVLCFNCNMSRGFNGYCPHEKKIDFFNLPIEDNVVMRAGR